MIFDLSRRRLLTDDCRTKVEGDNRKLFIFLPEDCLAQTSIIKIQFLVVFCSVWLFLCLSLVLEWECPLKILDPGEGLKLKIPNTKNTQSKKQGHAYI